MLKNYGLILKIPSPTRETLQKFLIKYDPFSKLVAYFCIWPKKFFSVHKPTRKHFKRRKVVVPNVNHSVMADLIDYRKYSRQNQGFKYILVVIDAFSRFAYTSPLKFKTAEDSAKAIDSIFSSFPHPPTMFSSDKGNELGFQSLFVLLSHLS